MSLLIEKFLKRVRSTEGESLPEGIKVLDIANISFHTALGSNEFVFNIWFKKHTGIANRKTFSYRVGSIDKCLQIKEELDKVYNMEEDDLFTEDNTDKDIDKLSNKQTQINSSDSFFN